MNIKKGDLFVFAKKRKDVKTMYKVPRQGGARRRLGAFGYLALHPMIPIFPYLFFRFFPGSVRYTGMFGMLLVFISLWVAQGVLHGKIYR